MAMTSRKDDAELNRIITEKRRLGELPQIPTPRAWAGNGSGELCSACESYIGAGEIEYEVEWQRGSDTRLLRFHELCYRLWSNA
jgi:hypothetical protein